MPSEDIALSTELRRQLAPAVRIRTDDLFLTKELLCQLSYAGLEQLEAGVGFEPTSPLSRTSWIAISRLRPLGQPACLVALREIESRAVAL